MARMIPDLTESQLAAHRPPVESDVYRALRDNTPTTWLVFFNLRLVKQTSQLPREHGEVDFLLFAPEYGVLVVEVKGGLVEVDDSTQAWHCIDDRGRRLILTDPARQALTAQQGITAAFRRKMGWTATDPHYLLRGTALLFPDIVDVARLAGVGRPIETIGGAESLRTAEQWIRGAFHFWANGNQEWIPLGESGMKAADELFADHIFVPRPLAHILVAEHARQLELTQQQAQVLRMLKYTPRARIAGAAGTGKTLLALQQARDYAAQGQRTLLVCYNRALSDFLTRNCRDVANLDVLTFDMLIDRRISDAKKATGADPIRQAREDRGQSEPLDRLRIYAAIRATEVTPFRYQAIVVDEGQDLAAEAFLVFRKLLEDRGKSPWLVFFDPNQAIYRPSVDIPGIDGGTYPLTVNCRNTNHIHAAAHAFFRGDDPADPLLGVVGEPLTLLASADLPGQAATIQAKVGDLLSTQLLKPGDISVLVAGDPKDAFFGALHAAGSPSGATWAFEQHWTPGAVAVDTVRRFKGLESVAVVLWGIEYAPSDIASELLYVALSRARSRVWVVGDAVRVRATLRRCAVSLDGLDSLLGTSVV